jgi:hypothetical protein
MAAALEVGVLTNAVAGVLAGEQQQIEAVGSEVRLEADEDLIEEPVLASS